MSKKSLIVLLAAAAVLSPVVEVAAGLERRTLDLHYRKLERLAGGCDRHSRRRAEKPIYAAGEVHGTAEPMALAVNRNGGLHGPRGFLEKPAASYLRHGLKPD